MNTFSIYSESSIIHLFSYYEEYVVLISRLSPASDGSALIGESPISNTFFYLKKKFRLPLSERGEEGGEALMTLPLRVFLLFLRLPLVNHSNSYFSRIY